MRHILTTLIFIIVGVSSLIAQIMPANSTVILNPPSPVILSEYYGIGSTSLQTIINFTDFSEPSWDVRLKVTIESADIKISTKDNFLPATPITLTPGVPLTLQGADFYDYLHINNLDLQGISYQALNQTGRLPEGIYEFCVEILDYNSGIPLSLENCAVALIYNEPPPVILNPVCEEVITPSDPQNIFFQWQVSGGASPTIAANSLYKLFVYEVTDDNVDPYFAVQNSNALLVYESDFSNYNSLALDFTTTLLTVGKKYVFRVRAVDGQEQDVYSNNGYSEWCWFYYGYPAGETLSVVLPANEYVFDKNEQKIFQWGAPEETAPGQSFNYTVKIYQVEDGQTPLQAVDQNTPWHEEATPVSSSTIGANLILNQQLEDNQQYAWIVVASSQGQEVARSETNTFYAPPLIEEFYAGSSLVKVLSLENESLDSLRGTARIQLSDDENNYVDAEFSNLKISEQLGSYLLEEGEILFEIDEDDFENIILTPTYQDNGDAYFAANEGKLSTAGTKLKGKIHWPLPHPVMDSDSNEVITQDGWFTLNSNYELIGAANVATGNDFELLDPMNFKLSLDPLGDIQVNSNDYTLRLQGKVFANDEIRTNTGDPYDLFFSQQEQLFYMELSNVLSTSVSYFSPFEDLKIVFMPKTAVVDFSESTSPGKLSGDGEWKGVYFPDFKVRFFSSNFDESNQLIIGNNIDYEETLDDDFEFWVTAQGLQLHYQWEVLQDDEEVTFDMFKTGMNGDLNIVNSVVNESKINGKIKIPFIDLEDEFEYEIPVVDNGLSEGYLLDDLTQRDVVFNPFGVENKVNITINRAVLVDNDRFELDIDAEIPALSATVAGISDFRVYGDGYIGVGGKNTSRELDQQVQGEYRTYPAFIEEVGAALIDGNYSFSYVSSLDLGEDIVGENGPPLLSVSSVVDAGDDVDNSSATNVPAPEIEIPNDAVGATEVKSMEMYIGCDNAIVEMEGYLSLTQNDPYWGTCFRGGINGSLKIPSQIDMGANMILGRQDNLDYWYFDAYFNDTEGMGVPVFNLFNLTAMEGRIYHHMKKDADAGEYLIDGDLDFGAAMYMQIMDQNGGKLFQADIGAEVEISGSDFVVQMEGDLSMVNETSRSSVGGAAVTAVGTELADEVLEAIGPISLSFDIAGGTMEVTAEGTTSGSFVYEKGDLGFGFDADMGSVPGIGFDFAKGSDEFHFNANAAGDFGLAFDIENNAFDVGLSGSNEAHLNFDIQGVSFVSNLNRSEKTGDLSFAFDETTFALGVESDGGFFNLSLDDSKSFETGFNTSGSAYLGVDYDGNAFRIEGDKTEGTGLIDLDIGGVTMSTSVNVNEKSATFDLSTSGVAVSVAGQKGVGGSFSVDKGSQHYEVAADIENKSALIDIQPSATERYFASVEESSTYSAEITKGINSIQATYGPDEKALSFATGDISLAASRSGDVYSLGLGYQSHNLSFTKQSSGNEIVYDGDFAKVTVKRNSFELDDKAGGLLKIDASGLYMNADLVANTVDRAGGIDTTFNFSSGGINLYAEDATYIITLFDGSNSVYFETENFENITAGINYGETSMFASTDGTNFSLGYDDFVGAFDDGTISLKYGESKSLALTTSGLDLNYEDYRLAMETQEGTRGFSIANGDDQFYVDEKGFALDYSGKRYAINEEEYLKVQIDDERYIQIENNGLGYHDAQNDLVIGGDDNYLLLNVDGKQISLTQDQEIVYEQDNYSAKLTKDLYVEVSDGTRSIGINGDDHLLSYAQSDFNIGIRGGSGVTPGVDITKGDNTVFVEGNRNQDVTVGVSNTDYGALSFTVDSEKNIFATYGYDDREISLKAGSQGIEFVDSDNELEEVEAEYLDGASEAPAMDGPQYIGEGLTETSNGRAVGSISLYYNSADQHFIGNGAVASTVPPCASGAIAIEVTPDDWSIDIGSEEQMIEVYPVCVGFGGGGWLSLDPNTIDLGLFVGWAAEGSIKIGGDIAGARLYAELGAELGVRANADLDPFKLNQAGVWVSVYGEIGVEYWAVGISGDITLFAIGLNGELLVTFLDSSTLVEGELSGYVNILDIVKANFNMGFSTTF